MYKLVIVSVFTLSWNFMSVAQISVTSNSLMNWQNVTQTIETDTSGSVQVSVGSAGENQMWDFSSFSGQSYTAEYQFFASQETPYASDYPTANYAFKVDIQHADATSMIYQYFNLTSDKFHQLGTVVLFNDTIFDKDHSDDITPLPIAYGNNWETASADTFEIPGLGATITKLSEKHTIDAWGKLKLPSGEYNCLRWKTEGTSEQVSVVAGMEIPLGSSTYIDYTWIGENSLFLASISSVENETDANFSVASGISWLKSVTGATNVAQLSDDIPTSFELRTNYPNPFNPQTTITFFLHEHGDITLNVYDVRGQLVKNLAAGSFQAGTHQAVWDGTNNLGTSVSGGNYFYKMSSNGQSLVRKMTLLK